MLRRRICTALAVLATTAAHVAALGQQRIIAFNNSVAGSLQLAGGAAAASSPGQILVSSNDYWGVIRAAGDLAVDFGRVTGTNLTLSNGAAGAAPASYTYHPVNNKNNTVYSTTGTASFAGPAYAAPANASTVIVAGTLGHSAVVDALAAADLLGDLAPVAGQWEAFVSVVANVSSVVPGAGRALVIAGSDPRGTIYGLYDVSEQMGVSPWYFWADVAVAQAPAANGTRNGTASGIFALPTRKVQASPSVRYRGLFLNDEQPALTDWVATRWADTGVAAGTAGFGAAFYALVFELLLRLRANYLWPAVWATMFEVDDPANQPLADAFEIVLGSSHTEPMMRAQNEFGAFYTAAGAGPWAYNLNNQTIDAYFRYGVQRAAPYARNALWTLGMRGTGDTAIEGLGTASIVAMLETLVAHQRQILADGLATDGLAADVRDVPQMWCLYKEVQSYVFAGLAVPDDVTLLWADDNWGNVRRLPRASEQHRAGGAGVYYHFDYVGDPRDYKWINTVQLAKTAEQLGLAFARGADRIWVANVGDLKGLELPVSHFFDLAYDQPRWGYGGHGGVAGNRTVGEWTTAWARREFASADPAAVASIVARYSMYASRRKFELVEPQTYSVLHYGEADAVLAQWAALVDDAQKVHDGLAAADQAAFFEMVLHPVLAGALVHRIHTAAATNALYAGQKRNAANAAIQTLLDASAADANLTRRWNALLGGKWAHMMDQTHLGYDGYWQQPMRNTLPAVTYVQTAFASLAGTLGVGVEGANATVPGDDKFHANSGNTLTTPPLDPFGPPRRYFDVFSRGVEACAWTAAASVPWVSLSLAAGTVGANGSDTRVHVSVHDWSQVAASTTVRINITSACRGLDRYGFKPAAVLVPVVVRRVPASFARGFVESDGTVAIDGAHYQRIVPAPGSPNVTYHTFRDYGRTSSGVGLWPLTTEKLTAATGPALEYALYLFANTTANVTVYLSPSQNYLGDDTPLEYTIALYPSSSSSSSSSSPPPAPVHVQPVGPSIGADMPAGWGAAAGDSIWGLTGNHTTTSFALASTPQAYTLRIQALLPSVVVQKIVVDTGGVRPSYLGPPESFFVGRDHTGTYNATTFADTPGTLGGTATNNCEQVYRA
ncbi:hypothetical protein HMPREF1624_08793 [Sporothrix schenckii ATCC 58251]|uniref:Gylcosyl hydrolase 115 C-terminal domain-containing protein n=1 Tax=Sporothrix schenckii (strain ATCC 58251 / de Perez 2211183) TaxID=1391915 RepID=U7PK57_SPOS1|nr:hypothetical protein HMPREF1624_08793 [Sporothrix schenckii ATCC 58251]